MSLYLENIKCTKVNAQTLPTQRHTALDKQPAAKTVGDHPAGSKEHKGAVQKIVPGASTLGSTSDSVKARCKCPCLIIRPGVRACFKLLAQLTHQKLLTEWLLTWLVPCTQDPFFRCVSTQSARNEKMRIKSMVNMAHLMEGQDLRGLKVCSLRG